MYRTEPRNYKCSSNDETPERDVINILYDYLFTTELPPVLPYFRAST